MQVFGSVILLLTWYTFFYLGGSQWVVHGAVDVDIGANPSAEGADEGEGVDDAAVKVVDIVDTFRLQVSFMHSKIMHCFFFEFCVLYLMPFNLDKTGAAPF